MFDRSTCAGIHLTEEPNADLAALTRLVTLVRDALHVGFAASKPRDSVVSSLSRDQNQGDSHATQAEAGTPSCTAANRPVRRRRADGDRGNARLVRATERGSSNAHQPDETAVSGAFHQTPDRLGDG